jgi:hypothetical protein
MDLIKRLANCHKYKRQFSVILSLCLMGYFSQLSIAQDHSTRRYGQRSIDNATSGDIPCISFLRGGGVAKIGFYLEEKEKITFLIEAKSVVPGVVSVN